MNKINLSRSFKALIDNQVISKAVNMTSVRNSSNESNLEFSTLKITNPHEFVFHVQMNRPEKRNAMNATFFKELKECFEKLQYNSDCRSIVLSGNGKGFTSGLDLSDISAFMNTENDDIGRRAFYIKKVMQEWQESMSSPEVCHKPVIASVHGHCVGGGIDLISACDIRYCSQDAWFSIKEVDIGLAADIGTLQRFPKIIGNDSLARELVYTARRFDSDEAKSVGFISRIFPDEETCLKESLELAKVIASKSPIAIQGSKINLIHSRDTSVADGLKYMNAWNSSMIQSEDVMNAAMAALSKETPVFSKL